MWKHRVIYVFTLIGAALFLVLYPLWFSWFLMVALLLILPLDLIISLPGMLFTDTRMTRMSLSLAAPQVLVRGEDSALVITMPESKYFPVNCIKGRYKITCEGFSKKQGYVSRSESGRRYEIRIDTSHSGVAVYETKRVWIVSLLGLFCIPVGLKQRKPILILPKPIKPLNTLALPQGVFLRPKPGGGFSDEHDLRPFSFGDAMRSVHWKVSAKLGSLVVREPLIPLTHGRLIQVSRWNGHQERDLILARLLWVSEYLTGWKLPHYISLDINGTCAEITKTTELHDYLYLVLDEKADSTRYQVPAPIGIEWEYRVDAEFH